jgi:hypothetical protein
MGFSNFNVIFVNGIPHGLHISVSNNGLDSKRSDVVCFVPLPAAHLTFPCEARPAFLLSPSPYVRLQGTLRRTFSPSSQIVDEKAEIFNVGVLIPEAYTGCLHHQ